MLTCFKILMSSEGAPGLQQGFGQLSCRLHVRRYPGDEDFSLLKGFFSAHLMVHHKAQPATRTSSKPAKL